MTTIACVFVRGHVGFTPEYVRRLKTMCQRWMPGPFRFVCLTDQPNLLKGIETIPIAAPAGCYAWWAKVELFSTKHGFSGRLLYLDLDTLIVSSLTPIVEYPSPFALIPDGGSSFQPKNGLAVIKKFNSSVMVMDAPYAPRVYDLWSPAIARRLWGDQDWLAEVCPHADTMPLEWFPRLSEVREGPPPDAKVILSKKPKNAEAAKKYPWFADLWRAA